MACSIETIPGLERLLNLATVTIKQKPTKFSGNKYVVLSADSEVLFDMKEEGGALTCMRKGHNRSFDINAINSQERTVFSLRRPYATVSDKVEVTMNGRLVIVVRKEMTFMKPVLSINDASDKPVLRIKGNFADNEFKLQTTEKKDIGSIIKKYGGVMKEMFSYADDYTISFPVDLDVVFKVGVIAACILIDYRYHES